MYLRYVLGGVVLVSRNRKVSPLAAAHANHAREVPLPFQDLDQNALSERGGGDKIKNGKEGARTC